jgi:hypothetical protein
LLDQPHHTATKRGVFDPRERLDEG